MARRIDKDVEEKIVNKYLHGIPVSTISRLLGIPRSTIYYLLKKRGVKRGKTKKEEIIRLARLGFYDEEIASILNVSRKYVVVVRSSYGIYRRGPRDMPYHVRLKMYYLRAKRRTDERGFVLLRELRRIVPEKYMRTVLNMLALDGYVFITIKTCAGSILDRSLLGATIIYAPGAEGAVAEFLAKMYRLKGYSVREQHRMFNCMRQNGADRKLINALHKALLRRYRNGNA